MRRAHLVVGLVAAAVFAGTGQVMRHTFPDAFRGDATMRMLFRSAHVDILLAALVNLALSLGVPPRERSVRRIGRVVASLLVLASPVLFTAAFFVEPAPGRLERPWVFAGLVAASAGVGAHLVLSWTRGGERGAARP